MSQEPPKTLVADRKCPFCSSTDIRAGFVWTSDGVGGDGIADLDWAEGTDPPETRFLLGRRRDARVIEGPNTPIRAYRCKACNSFFLYKLEVEEAPEDQGPEPDDTTEATECLSCGASDALLLPDHRRNKTLDAESLPCPNTERVCVAGAFMELWC